MQANTPTRPTDEVRHQIEVLVRELQALNDGSKVQRHLLGMELRDRWDQLQRRHADVFDAVRNAGRETLDTVREAVSDLRSAFTKLHDDAGIDREC